MASDTKRMKGNDDDAANGTSLADFGPFEMSRVLSESSDTKSVVVEGKLTTDGERAIVILEKTPFSKDSLDKVLSADAQLEPQFINDVYGKYLCSLKPGTSTYNDESVV